MTTTSDIVSAVGRKILRAKLSVGDTAITNALTRGFFPARWYLVVRAECSRVGINCPDGVFGFIKVAPDQTSVLGDSTSIEPGEDAA